MHDFGQDFLKTIQQIEIYKGSNGAHFGPSAISGAINLITDIDYNNHVSTTLLDKQNNTLYGNYTKITSDDLHINLKASTLKGKSRSALADGSEEDGVKNYQTNLNLKKWINDNLKLTSTLYTRKTEADYDSSVSKETGYTSNNKMHSLQTGLVHISKNSENFFKLHYHNYDRDYEDGGHLDEYESKALVAKGETKVILSDKISYGIGSEYKYDWGSFENRGNFKQSTKGHIKNLGFFGNTGYKFSENSILSLYGRTDDHNTTGGNQTYKVNFTKFINVFKLSLTHSTGLRNPSLYELYGSNNYGYKGHTGLNPEKSKSNELNTTYNFSENLIFDLTAYKTTIFERLEDNGSYTATENKKIDLNQKGIETGMLLKGTDQSFSIFSNFAKSKKTNGQSQVRRPDFSLGSNYSKNKINTFIGSLDFNLNYKYTGKHIDLDNGRKK